MAIYLKVEVGAGSVLNAFEEMIALAARIETPVQGNINGFYMTAWPKSTVEIMQNEYDLKVQARKEIAGS